MLASKACTTCSIHTIDTPLRLRRQSPRQFEPLAVEQSETAGQPIGLARKAAALQDRHAACIGLALAPAAAECRRDHEIFERAHAGKRLRDLKRAADAERAALRRRQSGDIASAM
jgi:hypothetical protein